MTLVLCPLLGLAICAEVSKTGSSAAGLVVRPHPALPLGMGSGPSTFRG
jgi:hypothetical protein